MLGRSRMIYSLFIAIGCFTSVAQGADEADYFLLNVHELRPYVPAGALDVPGAAAAAVEESNRARLHPRVVADAPGEAYWISASGTRFELPAGDGNSWGQIVVRLPKGTDFAGKLYYPNPTYTALRAAPIKIPATKSKTDVATRNAFYLAKRLYYKGLMQAGLPGGPWFRHQVRQADLAVPGAIIAPPDPEYLPSRPGEFYLPGGQSAADDENRRLLRMLSETHVEDVAVPLDTIEGVSTPVFDWKPILTEKYSAPDVTAAYVPADQHVFFFPTLEALVRLAGEADRQITPLVAMYESQSQSLRTIDAYRRQLGLRSAAVDGLLGPPAVKSVALTGGDLYFVPGTDVAVLFEARDPTTLRTTLARQMALDAAALPEVKHESAEMLGVSYESWRTADRTVSSYLATVGAVVGVTNSPVQLRNIIETYQKRRPSIAGVDAYRYYRNRYRPGDPDETGLLFLSDATSRRWSGPRWRIAEARRARDRVVLAELQAANLTALATQTVEPKSLQTDLRLSTAGEVVLTAAGVRSTTAGSLQFMTPIGELEFDQVTKSEADAYRLWKEDDHPDSGYDFDPIAMRLHVTEDRLAIDMTVTSRVYADQEEPVIALLKGAKLKPRSGDPHGAAVHGVFALDREAVDRLAGSTIGFGIRPLGWMGQSVGGYADNGPFWDELLRLDTESANEEFLMRNVHQLPVAANIEVVSAIEATAFLAVLRGLIEVSSPGTVTWEARTHGENGYVKVRSTEATDLAGAPVNMSIFYALTSDSLTVSPSEDLIKRALDRYAARSGQEAGEPKPAAKKPVARPDGDTPFAEPTEWLGGTFGFEMGEGAVRELLLYADRQQRSDTCNLSWSNLPALNEWKRLFPDQDPVVLHERLWGATLVCPAGGRYVWNESWQTMESTACGHPGEPKEGGRSLPHLREIRGVRVGLTLEDPGLTIRAELRRRK
jgi:hypothetical protein